MKIYQEGEHARLGAIVTNASGSYVDPVTIKITIEKLDGTSVATDIDMTQSATGVYYYDHVIGAPGVYRYNVVAVGTGGRTTIVKSRITVNAKT